jgi:hypothetical protein
MRGDRAQIEIEDLSRIFLIGMMVSEAACCASKRIRVEQRPAIGTAIISATDLPFSPALMEAATDVLLTAGRKFAGFEQSMQAGQVSILVIDQVKASETASSECPPRDRGALELCRWINLIRDNCLVASSHAIACDIHFLWRSYRYAHLLLLSSLVRPGTHEPYVDRYNLPRAFFEDIDHRKGWKALADDMAAVEQFYDKFQDLRPKRNMIFVAFLRFWLAHEAGHLAHGDDALDEIPCARDSRETLAASCSVAESKPERQADEFAASLVESNLRRRSHPEDASRDDSWGRVVPEYFRLELERIRDEARRRLGYNIEWRLDSSSPLERKAYLDELARLSVGDGHPTYLVRYTRLVNVLSRTGIPLSASAVAVRDHTNVLAEAHAVCAEVELGGTK